MLDKCTDVSQSLRGTQNKHPKVWAEAGKNRERGFSSHLTVGQINRDTWLSEAHAARKSGTRPEKPVASPQSSFSYVTRDLTGSLKTYPHTVSLTGFINTFFSDT